MGCDILPISKHTLNITSLGSLAADLSKRLGINVEYGYFHRSDLDKLYNPASHEGFNSLGRAQSAKGATEYLLTDFWYVEKELYKKYGQGFYTSEAYIAQYGKQNKEEIESLIADMDYYSVDLSDSADGHAGFFIYKEYLNCRMFYRSSWSFFRDELMGEKPYLDEQSLHEYRRNMMQQVLLTGGDKIYYLNDQGNLYMALEEWMETEDRWTEIEKFLINKCGKDIVNIAEYNWSAAYRKSLEGYNPNDLLFMDDFRDIKIV